MTRLEAMQSAVAQAQVLRSRPAVSILIKALNEELHIAAAIESAIVALDEIGGGEIVLADSASTDRTVEIAKRYPIRIVQLARPEDRSCGAGAQLGFQYSRGQYVYLMDGDMRLRPGFLVAALRYVDQHPRVAGVGGIIIEAATGNLEFSQREARHEPDRLPGAVKRLDCGGLYRRSAIESVGYLADRNLHGGEEGELGTRLRAHGWQLERIGAPSVDHYGHSGNAYRLLLKRISSGIASAEGETLRASMGRGHLSFHLEQNTILKLILFVYGWWISMIGCLFFSVYSPGAWFALCGLFAFPIATMSWRYRSLSTGLYSVAAWNACAVSFLPGFFRSRVPPTTWIESNVIRELPSGGVWAARKCWYRIDACPPV